MIRRDFSERDIHMAIDGELPADERAAYDAWLDANPEMKARSARFTADREALRSAFAGVLVAGLAYIWRTGVLDWYTTAMRSEERY